MTRLHRDTKRLNDKVSILHTAHVRLWISFSCHYLRSLALVIARQGSSAFGIATIIVLLNSLAKRGNEENVIPSSR